MSDRMAKIVAAGEADAEAFRAEERARVVAWLRGMAAPLLAAPYWERELQAEGEAYDIAANAIEQGQHLKDTPA